MISTAKIMAENRFAVPVHAATFRRILFPATKARPASSSVRSRVACPAAAAAAAVVRSGSGALISSMDADETPYETASALIAPARRNPNSAPPRPGPATCANDWVAPSLPFPSTSCSLPISPGT